LLYHLFNLLTYAGFLSDAKKYLSKNGLILLGANGFYVKREKLIPFFEKNGFEIIECVENHFTHSYVYVLR